MIQTKNLVDFFWNAVNEKWGYIWGTAGILWTQAKQNQKINYMVSKYGDNWKKSSDAKSDNYYYAAKDGGKWIDHMVADCSGMFKKVFEMYGEKIAHGSNSIWNRYCSKKGKLKNGKRTDGEELKPGTAVFVYKAANDNRSHIGLYVGDGDVIEASGTNAGVVVSKITDKKWAEWGELKNVDYSGTSGSTEKTETSTVITYPTIHQGTKGDIVTQLQSFLSMAGSSLTIDGIFGSGTASAVRAFQKKYGLTVDGIVGPKTWEKLLEVVANIQTPDLPANEKLVTVIIIDIPESEANALKEKYPNVEFAID